jgi:hypothetical protein
VPDDEDKKGVHRLSADIADVSDTVTDGTLEAVPRTQSRIQLTPGHVVGRR